MKQALEQQCDVLVIGSGIAGISAAIRASACGARVILASRGALFSGSSFYPGTWGLGLIGPADASDEADLAQTILRVGCGMATPALVDTLVRGIGPAIEELRRYGVRLRRAANAGQREFIPCFDHKHRDWNGIEFDSVRAVLGPLLRERGVQILDHTEALGLVRAGERVCGAVLSDEAGFHYIGAGAVVLACGGFGSLYRHHLCTEDVEGTGLSMAMDVGCELVNLEFLQIMPGYRAPAYQTVFNEKTFRFATFTKADGTPLLTENADAILAQRACHGPFTSRLISSGFDRALFDAWQKGEKVYVSYDAQMQQDPPEFVKTYFDWMKREKGIGMADRAEIGLFSHAANGGIRIDSRAWTGVPGLYAAGEITGGMHGADRLGGLSTANGLVFGRISGESAANDCAAAPLPAAEIPAEAVSNPGTALEALQNLMYRSAFVCRSETELTGALFELAAMRDTLVPRPSADPAAVTETVRLLRRMHTAEAVLKAQLLRRESRGSHFRSDYPRQDPALEAQILVRGPAAAVKTRWNHE